MRKQKTPNQKGRKKKESKSVRIVYLDGFKHTNIRIFGVPKEEREQDIEGLLEEIMTENFPYLVKEIDLQVQEVHRTANKRNPKRTTPRHIIIKMPKAKDKERILKAEREKQLERRQEGDRSDGLVLSLVPEQIESASKSRSGSTDWLAKG
uniref:L1 transposable element RRM domain-containing protein n=1 Tax=Pipistrellus kuhlii TaxID=59472 RepID=A0A7J7ZJ85_PIPKU|nr:hypothetical protein mPipKuh1_009544 [Pipistrellus kuhlii]